VLARIQLTPTAFLAENVRAQSRLGTTRDAVIAGRHATLGRWLSRSIRFQNLPALREQLASGLALELVDAVSDVESMAEASEILTNRLRARVTAIEEGLGATPELG
jgi:hypothetical protein